MIKNNDYNYFPSCQWEAHVSKHLILPEISQEQPAFGCQPAFGSHSWTLKMLIFVHIHTSALHESLAKRWKSMFLIFFQRFYFFGPCKRLCKHAFAGKNTQHMSAFSGFSSAAIVALGANERLFFCYFKVLMKNKVR